MQIRGEVVTLFKTLVHHKSGGTDHIRTRRSFDRSRNSATPNHVPTSANSSNGSTTDCRSILGDTVEVVVQLDSTLIPIRIRSCTIVLQYQVLE